MIFSLEVNLKFLPQSVFGGAKKNGQPLSYKVLDSSEFSIFLLSSLNHVQPVTPESPLEEGAHEEGKYSFRGGVVTLATQGLETDTRLDPVMTLRQPQPWDRTNCSVSPNLSSLL